MKYLMTILGLAVMIGCGEQTPIEINNKDATTIPVEIDQAEEMPMSAIFSELRYITLNTGNEPQIGRITKMQITDEFISMLDEAQKGVWIFNREGELVKFISVPEGYGPGEVITLFDFYIDDQNRIHILGRNKVVEYNLDAELENEFQFKYPGYKFSYFPDSDLYLIYSYGSLYQSGTIQNTGSNLMFINSSGELEDQALPIEFEKRGIKIIVYDNFPTYGDQKLFFGHPDPIVYEVSPEQINMRYFLDFGEHAVTAETYDLRENYNSENKFILEEIIQKGLVTFIMRTLETTKLTGFDFQVTNGTRYYAFYDKQNDSVAVASNLVNDLDYGIEPIFRTASNNKMFAVVQPHKLINKAETLRQDNLEQFKKPKVQDLLALTDSLTTYDNPIIMEMTVRSE